MLLDRFAGRRVLITGHAGFKGAWLTLLLHSLGAKVYGYSLLPNSKPRLYDVIGVAQLLQDECIADIRDIRQLRAFMQRSAPELVLHLAA